MTLAQLLEILAYSQHVHDSAAVAMEEVLSEEAMEVLITIELQAPLN
jgi:hypothetical protein